MQEEEGRLLTRAQTASQQHQQVRRPVGLAAQHQPGRAHCQAWAAEAQALLTQSEYRVTAAADRMGVRLEGPALAHVDAREITSDATVPGSIQVPGNGQPIVLLVDAQTAGGYPKIGTVVSADLARVADTRPGEGLRFAWVSAAQGEATARAAETLTRALLARIRAVWPGGVDEDALYRSNLVSGVVHALSDEYRPAQRFLTGMKP